MTRPSRALIDLQALRSNYALARKLHSGPALAVLKANAYGHGAPRCAHALADMADGFAVAFLDEALALRRAGVCQPILLLEGVFDTQEMDAAVDLGLWMTVHQESQLRLVEAHPRARQLHVWLKLDSGMHRAGFAPDTFAAAHARLTRSDKVARLTLMSHFARADEPDADATTRQLAAFDSATVGLAGAHSLCNSAGLLHWPTARRGWARPGIMLYGADPFAERQHGLAPVMTLESQVFAVRTLRTGEALGYGGTFVAQSPTRVGLVAVGYADGYPRSARNGTPVAVDGQAASLVGRVSMDMLAIDLTQVPGAGIGSRVELWGPSVDINEVARCAGTIAYELLCNVKRVPLVYIE